MTKGKRTRKTTAAPIHPEADPPTPDPPSGAESSASEVEHEPKAPELDELAGAVADVGGEVPPADESAQADAEEEKLLDLADAIAEDPGKVFADLEPEDVAEFLAMGFDIMAERRGEHWRLVEKEKARLSKHLTKVFQKYGFDWLGKWLPEIMSAALLYAAVARRLRKDDELAAARGEGAGAS